MENISRRKLLPGLGLAATGALVTSRGTFAQNPPSLKILILTAWKQYQNSTG